MQISGIKVQYMRGVEVKANKTYFASLMAEGGANMFIMKTRANLNNPITVSINKSVAFPISYDEYSLFDGTTELTYVFSQDCIVAIAKDLEAI